MAAIDTNEKPTTTAEEDAAALAEIDRRSARFEGSIAAALARQELFDVWGTAGLVEN